MSSMSSPFPENYATNGAAAGAVDQVTGSAHRAIDKASEAIHPGVDHLTSGAHQAVDSLSGAASRAADTISVKSHQLRDAQTRLTASCCTHVRERPLSSIGIAVASGFLLSWLLRQR